MLSFLKLPKTIAKASDDQDGDDIDMRAPIHAAHAVTTSSATTTSTSHASGSAAIASNGGPSTAALAEVSYLTGIASNGTVTSNSFWGNNGETAHKWGSSKAGTAGGTVSFYFDPASNFTATEKNTFRESFALWSSVANIQFVESTSPTANVKIQRGSDGNAYESDSALTTGSGSTIGSHKGQSLISIDTSVPGFDLSGSFQTVGGYGLQTAFHEIGHLLGLGHGGDYNGDVNPATQQNSAYDDRLWTTMSYIDWNDTKAKYVSSDPVTGTNWGATSDGYVRQSSSTIMPLDIVAAQQLYGAPTSTPLSGGQVFGFNTNITGLLQPFFDFTIDKQPVVTLFDTGTGNTLNLSGFSQAAQISLTPGTFSSAGGLVNNIAIAYGTSITTAIGGSGNDTIVGTTGNDVLTGGGGRDTLTGNGGADIFRDTAVDMNGDTITDFITGDTIDITNATTNGFAYSFANHILSYKTGSTAYALTISDLASAGFTLSADASGGVDLRLTTTPTPSTPKTPTVPTPAVTTPATGTVTYSVNSAAGSVYALYETILGHAPNATALQTYVGLLNAKTTVATVAQDLLASSEYTTDYGTYSKSTSSAFVNQLYKDGLHRAADAASLTTYDNLLAHGTSRAQVAVDVALSAESLADLASIFKAGVFVSAASHAQVATSASQNSAAFSQALYEGAFGHQSSAISGMSATSALDTTHASIFGIGASSETTGIFARA